MNMVRMKHLYLIPLFLIVFSINAYSQAGSLDITFGDDGIKFYDFGEVHDNGYGIVTLPDLKSVILGSTMVGASTAGVLFRIHENGDVDPTFGTDGDHTIILYGLGIYGRSLLQQPDGKYLVAGSTATTASDEDIFVARYLSDGTLDLSFNSEGYFISEYSTEIENCEAMALQSDGKIVLAGRTYEGVSFSQLIFARLNSDGTLDTEFGTNGYTTIDESTQDESINSVDFLSNGTIVGIGNGYQSNPYWGDQVLMAKLDSNGNPITSFGGNGVLVPDIFTDVSYGEKVVIRNDSLFVTGQQYSATVNTDLFLTKMDSSGVADPSFGDNGIVITYVDSWNYGFDIMLTSDSKIYISGTTGPMSLTSDFLLIRYLSDGSYDNTFDDDGIVTTYIRSDWDEAYAIGMQPDGKILLTGMSGGLTSTGENTIPIVRYLNDFFPGVEAEFTASETVICVGESVTFTDQSTGDVISWEWIFEGGSPVNSSEQNPTITYLEVGEYFVQLTVSNGTEEDTKLKENYIIVTTIPAQANTPSGLAETCTGGSYSYTTSSIAYVDTYEWIVEPGDAGTISGTGTTGTFDAAVGWTGTYTIKVRAENECGIGPWSETLEANLYWAPIAYNFSGGGTYCEGGAGLEVILDGSETGVDYELYRNLGSTGIIIPGTGDPLSFGLQTEEGFYFAKGVSDYCSVTMNGNASITVLPLPGQPSEPSGPESVCRGDVAVYSTIGAGESDSYTWTLEPPEAGMMTPDEMEVEITWSDSFSGHAYLTVYGTNDCGDGPASEELEVTHAGPEPEISGPQLVCVDDVEEYMTADNPGDSYTWEVTGGTIVGGSGTSLITVQWETVGTGTLMVTEENEMCSATSGIYEVVVDECTSIAENGATDVSIYPNPAHDVIHVELVSLDDSENSEWKIWNAQGKLMDKGQLSKKDITFQINTSEYLKGIYLLQIDSASGKMTKRIIIQ